MKFCSTRINGLFSNDKDCVGKTIRAIHHTERIVVAQGFGVKEEGIPLRFLAYIVPVLHLLKLLPHSATGEFYVAHHGVIRANGFDISRTTPHVSVIKDAVTQYSAIIHPEEGKRIRFLEDRSIENDLSTQNLIASLVTTVEPLCRQEEKIWKFIETRDGAASLNYMVEHALYMRDPLRGVNKSHWLVSKMASDMQHVIMVGCSPSEKIFHSMRQLLCKVVGIHSQWRSHQFFTPIGGKPPTYHPQPGEPLWTDRQNLPEDVEELFRTAYRNVSSERGERKEIIRDLLTLLLNAGQTSSFIEVKPSVARKIVESGELPIDLKQTLQRGWKLLRAF